MNGIIEQAVGALQGLDHFLARVKCDQAQSDRVRGAAELVTVDSDFGAWDRVIARRDRRN